MSEVHETQEYGAQGEAQPDDSAPATGGCAQPSPEQARGRVQWAYQGPARARTHYDSPPGLYDYSDLILAGLHKLLGGLIGDGARLILIVDHGPTAEVVSDHHDAWSVLDKLVCDGEDDDGEDETGPLSGPGSRSKLLS